MEALDLARWQFGVTTVYHFIFVPLTIGLSLLVAIMQTLAHRAKDPVRKDAWTRMTKFFGSMLIVNFGIGIATGIVQERSEEHTSELQSRGHLVCRLLL